MDNRFIINLEVSKPGTQKHSMFDDSSNQSCTVFDTRLVELENKNKELNDKLEQL